MARKLMWAAFAVVPLAVALRVLPVGSVARFTVAAVALVPLAWVISKATEEAEKQTNPAIGALLNATFGNATELLIAFFAIAEGAFEVVRGSLSGSVVSNLLLVLGLACLLGGRAPLDRRSTLPSVGLVGVATALLVVPAWAHWDAGSREEAIASSAVPVSAVLVLGYLAYATWDVRRQLRDAAPSGEAEWSLRRSLLALGAGVVATGAVSETVTSSIAGFSEAVGLTEFFVAATIVALVGNAAEHGTAVIVAAKGNVELGIEVALRSSAQVAAILIPAVALLSWLVKPLPLAFHPVELVAFAGSAALAGVLLARARSDRLRGVALVAAYPVAVLAFLLTHGLR